MSDDLRALVRAAALDEAAAADREFPYSGETFGRFRRDVRRRRAAGATMLAVGGLGLVAIATLGIGIWGGSPVAPALTPTPTSVPTPTDPTLPDRPGPEVVGTVTVHPNLPPAHPLEAGMLASATAGDGWSLVRYSADVDTETDLVLGPQVLYLVDHGGALYQAGDLGELAPGSRLVDWQAGSPRVLLATDAWGDDARVVVIDLETSVVEAELTPPDGEHVADARFARDGEIAVLVGVGGGDAGIDAYRLDRYAATGERLGTIADGLTNPLDAPLGWLLEPDGGVVVGDGGSFRRIAWDGSEVADLPVPAGVVGCRPERWWADGRVLAICNDDLGPLEEAEGRWRLTVENAWLFDVVGDAAPERLTSHPSLTPPDYGIEGVWDVGEQRYVQWAADCGGGGFGLVGPDGAYTELVAGAWVQTQRDDGFLARLAPSCDPYGELAVIGLDGAVRVVVPRVGVAHGVAEVLTP